MQGLEHAMQALCELHPQKHHFQQKESRLKVLSQLQ
jgi:hypothetical protein